MARALAIARETCPELDTYTGVPGGLPVTLVGFQLFGGWGGAPPGMISESDMVRIFLPLRGAVHDARLASRAPSGKIAQTCRRCQRFCADLLLLRLLEITRLRRHRQVDRLPVARVRDPLLARGRDNRIHRRRCRVRRGADRHGAVAALERFAVLPRKRDRERSLLECRLAADRAQAIVVALDRGNFGFQALVFGADGEFTLVNHKVRHGFTDGFV